MPERARSALITLFVASAAGLQAFEPVFKFHKPRANFSGFPRTLAFTCRELVELRFKPNDFGPQFANGHLVARQCSRLIEDNRVQVARPFECGAVADQEAVFGSQRG